LLRDLRPVPGRRAGRLRRRPPVLAGRRRVPPPSVAPRVRPAGPALGALAAACARVDPAARPGSGGGGAAAGEEQGRARRGWSSGGGGASAAISPQRPGPVSYTHLDVYKRQRPDGASRQRRGRTAGEEQQRGKSRDGHGGVGAAAAVRAPRFLPSAQDRPRAQVRLAPPSPT
ncbi:hypothetical protein BAE44_0012543, partial [Dichanthelium oligosanthes]